MWTKVDSPSLCLTQTEYLVEQPNYKLNRILLSYFTFQQLSIKYIRTYVLYYEKELLTHCMN